MDNVDPGNMMYYTGLTSNVSGDPSEDALDFID